MTSPTIDAFWSKVPDKILLSNFASALDVRVPNPNPESTHEKLIALLEAEVSRRGLS